MSHDDYDPLDAEQGDIPPDDELIGDELSNFQRERRNDILKELASRRFESLRIFEPLPNQQEYFGCEAHEILLIGGVRSGKTLTACVQDARIVTGQDPFDKYPEKDGKLVIVGFGHEHIGNVIYPMLFKWGAFRMIRDEFTNEWRAFRPKTDTHREHESVAAPPLIPRRFIKPKGFSWLNRSANIFSKVQLTTGWEIHAGSSKGEPFQGFKAHHVHLDEDLERQDWVSEMQARLPDAVGLNRAGKLMKGGRLTWSARPHSKNDALINMDERAEMDLGKEKPNVVRIRLRHLENPHIDEAAKQRAIEGWRAQGEDVLKMFSDGEFARDSVLVYPSFDLETHGMDLDAVDKHGVPYFPDRRVPDDWCRYLILDPGHAPASMICAAIPPPSVGDFVLFYEEVQVQNSNAMLVAAKMKDLIASQSFYAFIIDDHGSRRTEEGSGKTPRRQYTDEMRKLGVQSETTGHGFILGSDNIIARQQALRTWMGVRPDGTTKFRFLKGPLGAEKSYLPKLCWEMRVYKKKQVNGVTLDEANKRSGGGIHILDCVEYLVAYNPRYHKPKPPERAKSKAKLRLEAKQARAKDRRGDKGRQIHFGPISTRSA